MLGFHAMPHLSDSKQSSYGTRTWRASVRRGGNCRPDVRAEQRRPIIGGAGTFAWWTPFRQARHQRSVKAQELAHDLGRPPKPRLMHQRIHDDGSTRARVGAGSREYGFSKRHYFLRTSPPPQRAVAQDSSPTRKTLRISHCAARERVFYSRLRHRTRRCRLMSSLRCARP